GRRGTPGASQDSLNYVAHGHRASAAHVERTTDRRIRSRGGDKGICNVRDVHEIAHLVAGSEIDGTTGKGMPNDRRHKAPWRFHWTVHGKRPQRHDFEAGPM